jgi:hypothetical protein
VRTEGVAAGRWRYSKLSFSQPSKLVTDAAHIVNGRTVNVATQLQQPDPQNPGQFIPLTRGKIAIEIEYADIGFRRIEVKAI